MRDVKTSVDRLDVTMRDNYHDILARLRSLEQVHLTHSERASCALPTRAVSHSTTHQASDAESTKGRRSFRNSFWLAFEKDLAITNVYKKINFWTSRSSLLTNEEPQSRWSTISDLSLADVMSSISVLNLAITSAEVYNAAQYDSNENEAFATLAADGQSRTLSSESRIRHQEVQDNDHNQDRDKRESWSTESTGKSLISAPTMVETSLGLDGTNSHKPPPATVKEGRTGQNTPETPHNGSEDGLKKISEAVVAHYIGNSIAILTVLSTEIVHLALESLGLPFEVYDLYISANPPDSVGTGRIWRKCPPGYAPLSRYISLFQGGHYPVFMMTRASGQKKPTRDVTVDQWFVVDRWPYRLIDVETFHLFVNQNRSVYARTGSLGLHGNTNFALHSAIDIPEADQFKYNEGKNQNFEALMQEASLSSMAHYCSGTVERYDNTTSKSMISTALSDLGLPRILARKYNLYMICNTHFNPETYEHWRTWQSILPNENPLSTFLESSEEGRYPVFIISRGSSSLGAPLNGPYGLIQQSIEHLGFFVQGWSMGMIDREILYLHSKTRNMDPKRQASFIAAYFDHINYPKKPKRS